jgi:hypothetical protein
MLSSRMFTTAFRFFAGLATFSLIAAFVSGFTSETQSPMNRVMGPLTLGWKGGIGNHFAYTVFVGVAVAAATLAGILIAFRDADPEAEAQVVHTESVPLTRAPVGVNYLPALGALAFILLLIGAATESGGLMYAAVATLVVVAFTWTLRTWAERATGGASDAIGGWHALSVLGGGGNALGRWDLVGDEKREHVDGGCDWPRG